MEKLISLFRSPASSEFLINEVYDLGFKDKSSNGDKLKATNLGSLYRELIERYPIVLLEDPFGEDDWEAWTAFNESPGVELVGDDMLATNINRMKIARERKACNGLLLKINQIGTVTEACKAYVVCCCLGSYVLMADNCPGRGWRTLMAGAFSYPIDREKQRMILLPT